MSRRGGLRPGGPVYEVSDELAIVQDDSQLVGGLRRAGYRPGRLPAGRRPRRRVPPGASRRAWTSPRQYLLKKVNQAYKLGRFGPSQKAKRGTRGLQKAQKSANICLFLPFLTVYL